MFLAQIYRILSVCLTVAILTGCAGSTDTASNANGDDSTAAIITINSSTIDEIAPSKPANLRLASILIPNEVSLAWNLSVDNVNVKGYRIYRDGVEVSFVEHNSYRDDSVIASHSYAYYIEAIDYANNTSTSDQLIVTTPDQVDYQAPTIPSNVSSSNEQTFQLTLTWDASSDDVSLTGYRIYRNGNYIATTVTATYTDTGLTAETAYIYQVQAYDSSNNMSTSDSLIATTLPDTHARTVALSWRAPTRNTDDSCLVTIDGYILMYGNASSSYNNSLDLPLNEGNVSCNQTGFDNTCGSPVLTCNYTTSELTENSWYFAVQVYDQSGNISALSNETLTVIN